MERLLLVEDDADIAQALVSFLQEAGYRVTHCDDGLEANRLIHMEKFDLLMLDIMLPGVSGLDLCKMVRIEDPQVPILMLTSLDGESDRVLGLELGADDYLTKPFSLRECKARVRALLRRSALAAPDSGKETLETLYFEGLSIGLHNREVRLNGEKIELTVREFDLLYHLAKHEGQVFNRGQLLDSVWGYSHSGYEHTVNTHINRLRKKLCRPKGDRQEGVSYIETVWGVGYKFSADLSPGLPLTHAAASVSSSVSME